MLLYYENTISIKDSLKQVARYVVILVVGCSSPIKENSLNICQKHEVNEGRDGGAENSPHLLGPFTIKEAVVDGFFAIAKSTEVSVDITPGM